MKDNNIILIGMPASGKSTIGVVLAKTLGKKFTDTDLVIQNRQGKLLQQIIDEQGLDAFLQAEEDAILAIESENTVIATGGSAVLSEKAMAHLKKLGKIVYLFADCASIEQRLCNIETRGIARKENETTQDIFRQREPLYQKYADLTIKTSDFSVERAIEDIITHI